MSQLTTYLLQWRKIIIDRRAIKNPQQKSNRRQNLIAFFLSSSRIFYQNPFVTFSVIMVRNRPMRIFSSVSAVISQYIHTMVHSFGHSFVHSSFIFLRSTCDHINSIQNQSHGRWARRKALWNTNIRPWNIRNRYKWLQSQWRLVCTYRRWPNATVRRAVNTLKSACTQMLTASSPSTPATPATTSLRAAPFARCSAS